MASNGITSTQANRSRMATSRASTAACVTNASTRRYSPAWPKPAASWPYGATTTTTSGRIPLWATRPQQKRAGRLSYLIATRPARLSNPKPTTINPKDSRYERGTTGGQVRTAIRRSRLVFYPLMAPLSDSRSSITSASAIVTCHWSFIQPRPEPVADFRLSAWFEQSPGARNPHRVQRDGRLRLSGAGQNLQGSGSRGPSGAFRCCNR